MLRHHPTLRMDIGVSDLTAALAGCLLPGPVPAPPPWWSGDDAPVISLTLRSAFDLYLAALALPAGGEILISAITHPEIVAIVRAHGLVPIPVDVDAATMAMQAPSLLRAMGPRVQAVMVTHLFGGRLDLTDVAAFCQSRGVLLLEDCAQIFGGGYAGHPQAAASFFSFGPIKTATALGGAVTRVRDADVRSRMAAIQATYPRQSRSAFARRIAKYAGAWAVLRIEPLTRLASWLVRRRGQRPSDLLRRMLRNVAGGFRLQTLRQQPAWPLLRLLGRRLRRHTPDHLQARRQAAERLHRCLAGMERPGGAGLDHQHWIFPVVVADPEACSTRLLQAGFHTLTGLSNLSAFDPPTERPDLAPKEAWRLTRHSVLLPLHVGMSPGEIDRLGALMAGLAAADAAVGVGDPGSPEPCPGDGAV